MYLVGITFEDNMLNLQVELDLYLSEYILEDAESFAMAFLESNRLIVF